MCYPPLYNLAPKKHFQRFSYIARVVAISDIVLLILKKPIIMTAFVPANIPSSVNTLEELAVWAISALAEINPTASIVTAPGASEVVFSAYPFTFRNQPTFPERMVLVAYLPLAVGWRSAGKLFSNGVVEVSTTALPASYTTN